LKNKILLQSFVILIILIAASRLAAASCAVGSVGCEEWGNIYSKTVDSLASYWPGNTGTVNNQVYLLFYPVDDWEVEACAYGLSTDVQPPGPQTLVSKDPSTVYDMTITLNAEKYFYKINNITLYTVAWYVQPIDGATNYSLYLVDGKSGRRQYFPDTKGLVAGYVYGSAGYESQYYNLTYDHAVIEDSSGNELFESPIYESKANYG